MVNVGEFLSVWSDGAIPRTAHRVVASPCGGARTSATFFCIPNWDAPMAPLGSDGAPLEPTQQQVGDMMPFEG